MKGCEKMERLGVFATDTEIEHLKVALDTSGMYLSGGQPMSNPQKDAHRLALEHGLPEIDGYYGCDLRTGEFVKA
jgi:hypothetical protein